ncbi:MAG TPA: SDR family NAD(P)-dependent oxidoreductase [Pseudonocardia sp.]|jgi:hypothetical protein
MYATGSSGPPAWRCALVTGASSGIGLAIAERLAADRVNLVLVARRAEVLGQVSARLSRFGVSIEVLVADLAELPDRDRVGARLADPANPVDLLVNCAGAGLAGPLIGQPAGQRRREAELNCVSVLGLCHAAASSMVPRGHGTIINVGSGLGFYPFPGAAVYAASKAFVCTMTAALRYELRNTGVRVTLVAPGPTRTAAAGKAGVNLRRLPGFLIASPERVAAAALAAARANRAVEQVSPWNRMMTLGRFAPARLTQPAMARIFRRFTGQQLDSATPTS